MGEGKKRLVVKAFQLLGRLQKLRPKGLPLLCGKLLPQLQEALEVALQGAEGIHRAPQAGGLLAYPPSLLRVLPEGRVFQAFLQLL
jgi:hypothetical protein